MTVLKICVGSSCHLKGSFEVVQQLKQLVEDHHLNDQVEMQASFCMKNCQRGVCVAVDDEIFSVSPTRFPNSSGRISCPAYKSKRLDTPVAYIQSKYICRAAYAARHIYCKKDGGIAEPLKAVSAHNC